MLKILISNGPKAENENDFRNGFSHDPSRTNVILHEILYCFNQKLIGFSSFHNLGSNEIIFRPLNDNRNGAQII